MKFGEDKCAFMSIVKGERKMYGNRIYVEGLEINELQVEDSCKYLGLDEDIAYIGELNKNRVKTEYLTVFGKFGNLNFIARIKSKLITCSLFQY